MGLKQFKCDYYADQVEKTLTLTKIFTSLGRTAYGLFMVYNDYHNDTELNINNIGQCCKGSLDVFSHLLSQESSDNKKQIIILEKDKKDLEKNIEIKSESNKKLIENYKRNIEESNDLVVVLKKIKSELYNESKKLIKEQIIKEFSKQSENEKQISLLEQSLNNEKIKLDEVNRKISKVEEVRKNYEKGSVFIRVSGFFTRDLLEFLGKNQSYTNADMAMLIVGSMAKISTFELLEHGEEIKDFLMNMFSKKNIVEGENL